MPDIPAGDAYIIRVNNLNSESNHKKLYVRPIVSDCFICLFGDMSLSYLIVKLNPGFRYLIVGAKVV